MAKWSNEKMADLTRKLADTAIEQNELYQAALRDAKEAEAYAKELEAKLAKAFDGLREAESAPEPDHHVPQFRNVMDVIGTTLAELTGGKK